MYVVKEILMKKRFEYMYIHLERPYFETLINVHRRKTKIYGQSKLYIACK